MTIHYHGLPITPLSSLETLAGKFACCSFAHPEQTKRAHEIMQGVMLDNGAYSIWKSGKGSIDVGAFWAWAEPFLDCPTTWAVIPDKIEASNWRENAMLIQQTPYDLRTRPYKVAPVWHLHEPIEVLCNMAGWWPRICFGSSAEYAIVGSEAWHRRVSEAFDALYKFNRKHTMIHMLRGMRTVKAPYAYPFYSVDSTDVARNHHAAKNGPGHARLMADAWDHQQCPIYFGPKTGHQTLIEGVV